MYKEKQQTKRVITVDPIQLRISRGASLNLAADYMQYQACGGALNLKEWWAELIEHAEKIAKVQIGYVNKRT